MQCMVSGVIAGASLSAPGMLQFQHTGVWNWGTGTSVINQQVLWSANGWLFPLAFWTGWDSRSVCKSLQIPVWTPTVSHSRCSIVKVFWHINCIVAGILTNSMSWAPAALNGVSKISKFTTLQGSPAPILIHINWENTCLGGDLPKMYVWFI